MNRPDLATKTITVHSGLAGHCYRMCIQDSSTNGLLSLMLPATVLLNPPLSLQPPLASTQLYSKENNLQLWWTQQWRDHLWIPRERSLESCAGPPTEQRRSQEAKLSEPRHLLQSHRTFHVREEHSHQMLALPVEASKSSLY